MIATKRVLVPSGRASDVIFLRESLPVESSRFRSGFLFGMVAYVWWGLVPLYFRQIRDVWHFEILAHRVIWSIVLMAGILAVFGGMTDIRRVFGQPRLLLTLGLSATLLSTNWLLYILATVTNRVTDASLGYYMMPLVNAFLATVFLGEKLRQAHYPALALIGIGVSVPMVVLGSGWLSLALPVSFGIYGVVRKTVAVESFTGLVIETLWLLPFSIGCLVYRHLDQGLSFAAGNSTLDGLLIFSGVITVIPLLTFTLSIRRLPLLTVMFIQFLSPTMQFLVALFWNQENPKWPMWFAMACVWVAVAIFIIDAIVKSRQPKREGTT
jgi:chloramphenicol-sensitive protein RarD